MMTATNLYNIIYLLFISFFPVIRHLHEGASTKYSLDQGSGFVLGDEVMMC